VGSSAGSAISARHISDVLDPALVLRRRQIFRLASGMALSSALAFGVAWPLSYITPVFTAKLLVAPRALPVKAQAAFLVLLWVGLTVGTELLLPLLQYPAIHILLTGLLLFLLFHARAGGANPILVVFLLIGVIVIPLVGTVQPSLARSVADGLFFCAAVSTLVVFALTALLPDPDVPPAPSASAPARAASPPEGGTDAEAPPAASGERAILALRSVAVLFPLVLVLQLYSLTGAIVMLVFTMMLSLEPSYGGHLKAGSGLILANLAGGLVGVVLYELLVMVPSFSFLLLLCFTAGLLVGDQIFSGTPMGKLLSAGITAVFIVLGPSLTGDTTAGASLATRLALIFAAVVYVVLAFGLLRRLMEGGRNAPS